MKHVFVLLLLLHFSYRRSFLVLSCGKNNPAIPLPKVQFSGLIVQFQRKK